MPLATSSTWERSNLHFTIPTAVYLEEHSIDNTNVLREIEGRTGVDMIVPLEAASEQLKENLEAQPLSKDTAFGYGVREVVESLREAAANHPDGVFRLFV